ncbi:MAG: DUF1801 domain-containing protein [Methanomicrobiaceae archaeon]|nr:DUF1801 domain-containing protein [Methanomicrobiaceae archaeon]
MAKIHEEHKDEHFGRKFKDINEYIESFPPDVRNILEQLRNIIRENAPEAEEAIRYGMPTFRLKGNLVHFAAFAHHIGFYPAPSGIAAFAKDITPYKHAKGSIQFPLDKQIPYDLVKKIVRFRVREQRESGKKKR